VIFLWLSVCTELRKGGFLFQDSYQMSTNNGQKTEWCGSAAPLNEVVLNISTTMINKPENSQLKTQEEIDIK